MFTKENSRMIREMVKVHLCMQTVLSIRVTGWIIIFMGKASLISLADLFIEDLSH